MNEKKIIKFNLYMSCVLLLAFIIMFVGVTIAYFSDRKQLSATLTAGNVEVALSQSDVKPDLIGNLVEDPDKPPIVGDAERFIPVSRFIRTRPSPTSVTKTNGLPLRLPLSTVMATLERLSATAATTKSILSCSFLGDYSPNTLMSAPGTALSTFPITIIMP